VHREYFVERTGHFGKGIHIDSFPLLQYIYGKHACVRQGWNKAGVVMSHTIHAVFENGVFRPMEKVRLPENQEVEIVIQEDSETQGLAYVAENGGAFDYLADKQEDIYRITDGEPIE
jgi:predicted DNA-binding antitoxin AbrB/MazE fold protein